MRIYQVDAFANKVFEGNPAGVCILAQAADEKWMQDVAMEMNLPETAFLYKTEGGFNLRWFTPCAEVDLCGHATLASAHVLWDKGLLNKTETAVFFTKSGRLTAEISGELIYLNFPALAVEPVEDHSALEHALGAPVVYMGRNPMDYIVELENESAVLYLTPDMTALMQFGRGVIVTAKADLPGCDFVSRFFAPAIGIPEDPVTGSAHCCLGPYWQSRLGKSDFTAYQASKRGGWLKVEVHGDRVRIGGKAVTVFEAEMRN